MICSLQLEVFQYLSDVSLIRLECEAATIPFNDAIQYASALRKVSAFSQSLASGSRTFLIGQGQGQQLRRKQVTALEKKPVPRAFGEITLTISEHGSLLGSADPVRHGYPGIMDDIWSVPWAPADGHMSMPAGCLAATKKQS